MSHGPHAAAGCPTCHRKLDGASSVAHPHKPSVGDLTVCLYCGTVLAFTAVDPIWVYRLATDRERAWLEQDPAGQQALLLADVWKAINAGAVPHKKEGHA